MEVIVPLGEDLKPLDTLVLIENLHPLPLLEAVGPIQRVPVHY
jgi:hypothetical protein